MVNAHVDVGILVYGNGKIGRYRRQPRSVGGEPTPRLSTQELPLLTLYIQPIQAKTQGMGIGGLEYRGCVVAVEVRLQVTDNIIFPDLVRDVEADARVLCRGAKFSEVTGGRIAERNHAKTGSGRVARIRCPKDVFEIHITARREIGATDPELERGLLGPLLSGGIA